MKNLLFITWDGPQTSYIEGLFMPIFQEIAKKTDIQFHVIQFTWASSEKTATVKKVAQEAGIVYTAFPVHRKPIASLGSFYTVLTASKKLEKYIKENQIDIVMPRSTFPAMMVNALKRTSCKIIFDADGLPLEERVDFAGLKKESRQYQWLKSAETKLLKNADAVITRSQKAIDIHVAAIGEHYRSKFCVVHNGRDPEIFKKNPESRAKARLHLEVEGEDKLFVYCGSLGDQYCFTEMLQIVDEYQKSASAKFLILTGNTAFAEEKLDGKHNSNFIIKSVPFEEVSFWLAAADVAFALRKPSFSMQGVAPIKLGEYLLMGLPTIASKGIGDTEEMLQSIPNCYLFDHENKNSIAEVVQFSRNLKDCKHEDLRQVGLHYFSLSNSADSYLAVLNRL